MTKHTIVRTYIVTSVLTIEAKDENDALLATRNVSLGQAISDGYEDGGWGITEDGREYNATYAYEPLAPGYVYEEDPYSIAAGACRSTARSLGVKVEGD